MNGHGLSVLGALVALIALVVAAIVVLSLLGDQDRGGAAIAQIVALVGPTFAALLVLLKVESVERKVDDTESKVTELVNGNNNARKGDR